MSYIGITFYNFFNRKWFFDKVYHEYITQNILNFGYFKTYKLIDRGIIEILGPYGIAKNINKISFNLSNISKKGSYHYILPNSQLSNLNTQLVGETEIISVLKDTIFIEIGKNISKKVLVVPITEIKFKLGYNLIEKLTVIPDSIVITGSEKYIDSIKEISTVQLKLNDVYENIDKELGLIISKKNRNISR